MKYIDHVHAVAGKHSGDDISTVELALFALWKEYEETAKVLGYDIFHDSAARHVVRAIGQRLIRTLYRIPGADPVADANQLAEKDREYGGSWLKRGGIGAFMMATRKWDRVETLLLRPLGDKPRGSLEYYLTKDTREEGIRDDLGDLRRYLILFEAQYMVLEDGQKKVCPIGIGHGDGESCLRLDCPIHGPDIPF